jgi:hypothetical protein
LNNRTGILVFDRIYRIDGTTEGLLSDRINRIIWEMAVVSSRRIDPATVMPLPISQYNQGVHQGGFPTEQTGQERVLLCLGGRGWRHNIDGYMRFDKGSGIS